MWALKRGWDWAITRMMAHHTGLPTRDASDRENDWGYFVQWAPLDHFHLLQREHPQLGHRFVHNPGLLGKLMKNADPATHLAPLSPDQPWPRSPFNAMRMFWGMKTRQWLDCRDVLGFSLNRDHELLSMGCAIFNWATLGLPRQHICFPELFVTELAAIRQIKEISMGGCCTRYLPHHIRAPFQRLRVSSADPLINGCLTLPPPIWEQIWGLVFNWDGIITAEGIKWAMRDLEHQIRKRGASISRKKPMSRDRGAACPEHPPPLVKQKKATQ